MPAWLVPWFGIAGIRLGCPGGCTASESSTSFTNAAAWFLYRHLPSGNLSQNDGIFLELISRTSCRKPKRGCVFHHDSSDVHCTLVLNGIFHHRNELNEDIRGFLHFRDPPSQHGCFTINDLIMTWFIFGVPHFFKK